MQNTGDANNTRCWVVALVFGIFLFYIVTREYQQQGCTLWDLFALRGKECNRKENMVYLLGKAPQASDSNSKLFQSLLHSATVRDRTVLWRQAFLLGFVICGTLFFVWFVIPQQQGADMGMRSLALVPNWSLLVVGFLLVVAILYFEKNYQNYHLHRFATQNIHDVVDILRDRCSE